MDILHGIACVCTCLLLVLCCQINAQENNIVGIFRENPPMLMESLQLNCAKDGDKIKISDILYRTTGCSNSESRPQDPAAERNRLLIDQCTGKRTCVVPADSIHPPFIPKRPANCQIATKYQINIAYVCVEQEKIRSMCSSFTTQEYVGYLSTPSYPMLLKPGEPAGPCRCHLEATLNSRIIFTLLESNLVGNSSGNDMNSCQTESNKQYLEIASNHGMSTTYMLCSHKYNTVIQASANYDLLFENPIGREAGAFWIQYSAEEQNAMVKVSCYEPVVTTIAPIFYTKNLFREGNRENGFVWGDSTGKFDYRLLLGIVAASLFLLIIIAIIILTVKYRRKMSHFMMKKYSRKSKDSPTKNNKKLPPPSKAVEPMSLNNSVYLETHLDGYDDSASCGKPTAHIPPQLSVNEKLSDRASEESHKLKNGTGKPKYSTFQSSYLPKPRCDSDTEASNSSISDHSHSQHSPTSETSSAPSVRRVAPPGGGYRADPLPDIPAERIYGASSSSINNSPKFEDIWVRVNTPEGTPTRGRSYSVHPGSAGSEAERLLVQRPPTVSFSQAGDTPDSHLSSIPLMQRSADSRNNSDDEEMDIKFVNPNLVSPRKTPIHIVKPALKSSMQSLRSTPGGVRRDSAVKFSKEVTHMRSSTSLDQSRSPRGMELVRPFPDTSILKHTPTRKPPPVAQKPGMRSFDDTYSPGSPQLIVDLGGPSPPRKSKSLPGHSRRQNSQPSLKTYSQTAKRPKRKCASDNDQASSSSQEHLSPIAPPSSDRSRRGRQTGSRPDMARSSSAHSNRQLPIGMNRRTVIPENDDDLIIRIDNDLDHMMKASPKK